jgi:hypothetical protein
MTSITTRAGKGSPLTHNEVDANFTNLNTDKLDTAGIALGSAASPTIKFTGDTNTGIYSPGSDQLAVSTGGTGRLFIDNSGRVGIGTSSPNTTLHVYGGNLKVQQGASLDFSDVSELTLSSAYRTGRILSGYTNPVSVTETYIAFHTNRTGEANDTVGEAMRIAGGNVGIGTSAPTAGYLLDCRGNVKFGSPSTAGIYLGVDANIPFVQGFDSGATYNQLKFLVGGSEAVRIDSSGRVGVGTSSPTFKLMVVAPAGAQPIFLAGQTGVSNGYEITSTGSALTHVWSTAGGEKLRLTDGGNLGIGTTAPTTLLDVNADTVRVRTARTPASATATGATGEICWDANYMYVCTATNTWRRTAISSW